MSTALRERGLVPMMTLLSRRACAGGYELLGGYVSCVLKGVM